MNHGEILFNTTANPLVVNISKINFTVEAEAFNIKLVVHNAKANWTLIFFYKMSELQGSYVYRRSVPFKSSDMILNDLFMSTKYEVCLSVSDIKCPMVKDECQACKVVTTKEAPPFAPTNLVISETINSMLSISWQDPELPSGNITSYNVVVNGKCIINATTNCNKDKYSCTTSETQSVSNKSAQFTIQPYWDYKVEVRAVNSEGPGLEIISNYTTQEKLPQNITLHSESNSIKLSLNFDCPYTGPAQFKVKLYKVPIKGFNTEYMEDLTEPFIFDNLEPNTSYSICVFISSNSESRPTCYNTTTRENKPEHFITLSNPILDATQIKFKIETLPAIEIETLIYYFEVNSNCLFYDDKCAAYNNCSHETLLSTRVHNSSLQNFDYTFEELIPNWQYQFRVLTKSSVGNGSWSNWTQWYQTLPISDEMVKSTDVNFSITPQNTSIKVELIPICPYKGNYSRNPNSRHNKTEILEKIFSILISKEHLHVGL